MDPTIGPTNASKKDDFRRQKWSQNGAKNWRKNGSKRKVGKNKRRRPWNSKQIRFGRPVWPKNEHFVLEVLQKWTVAVDLLKKPQATQKQWVFIFYGAVFGSKRALFGDFLTTWFWPFVGWLFGLIFDAVVGPTMIHILDIFLRRFRWTFLGSPSASPRPNGDLTGRSVGFGGKPSYLRIYPSQ